MKFNRLYYLYYYLAWCTEEIEKVKIQMKYYFVEDIAFIQITE